MYSSADFNEMLTGYPKFFTTGVGLNNFKLSRSVYSFEMLGVLF